MITGHRLLLPGSTEGFFAAAELGKRRTGRQGRRSKGLAPGAEIVFAVHRNIESYAEFVGIACRKLFKGVVIDFTVFDGRIGEICTW